VISAQPQRLKSIDEQMGDYQHTVRLQDMTGNYFATYTFLDEIMWY